MKELTLRDNNPTETDKTGLQPWTAVSFLLELARAFSLVTTSNGCIWHYKFDLNVKKAMFLSPFKVGVNVNLNGILRGLKKR